MNALEALRLLRAKWRILAVAGLLGGALALSLAVALPQNYTSNLKLYVSAQSQDSASSAYQGSLLSQQRVRSYTELLMSPRIAQQSIQALSLDESADRFLERIEASSALDSVVIDVNVSAQSPEEAQRFADTVGGVFTTIVAEIERPERPGDVAPVVIRVVQPGTVPAAPSSVSIPTATAGGLLLGVMLGAAVLLIRRTLDDSLHSVEQFEELSNKPNLGRIPFSKSFEQSPLVIGEGFLPQSLEAEAFKQVRTALHFSQVDRVLKSYLITSAEAGEGKTTSIINLASAMAESGQRVLLVDADLRRPKIGSLFGLESLVGLTTILAARVNVWDAIQRVPSGKFDVLSSGELPPNPSELLGSDRMRTLLAQFGGRYDVVLIDSPPLLPVTDAAALASSVDGVVIVGAFNQSKRAALSEAVAIITRASGRLLGTILTRVPTSGVFGYQPYQSPYVSNLNRGRTNFAASGVVGLDRNGTGKPAGSRPVPHKRF